MPTLIKVANKRETLNIRLKPEERGLVDHAARMVGKNRTDFILDAARLAAEETLLDQVIIITNPEAYAKFLAQLEMPPNPNNRLLRTMQNQIRPKSERNFVQVICDQALSRVKRDF